MACCPTVDDPPASNILVALNTTGSLNSNSNVSNDACPKEVDAAVYDKVIMVSLTLLSVIIGLAFNGAGIFLFVAYWRRLSKHMINWLMLNMALTNILIIITATIVLLVEEFRLVPDWRFIEKIFLADKRRGMVPWGKIILSIQNIAFNVTLYSLLALSIERWLIISGRRRKACKYELTWTATVIGLIWAGALVHAYCRQTFLKDTYFQVAMALLISNVIPGLGIGGFFLASARWLLYSYGASDDFSVKNLKARYRTARYLICYVVVLPVCTCAFAVLYVLFLFDPTRDYLQCTVFGLFLVHLAFLLNNFILQCLHPTLLFMLSSRYRQCAYSLLEKMRDCAAPSDDMSYE